MLSSRKDMLGEAGRIEKGGKRDVANVRIWAMFDLSKNKRRGDDGPLAGKPATEPRRKAAFPLKTLRSCPGTTLQPPSFG